MSNASYVVFQFVNITIFLLVITKKWEVDFLPLLLGIAGIGGGAWGFKEFQDTKQKKLDVELEKNRIEGGFNPSQSKINKTVVTVGLLGLGAFGIYSATKK